MSTIPFLFSYEPYRPSTGTRAVNSINDMVIINYNAQPTVNYEIGTNLEFSEKIFIRNVTLNATLEIVMEFDATVTTINANNTTSPYVFTLGPGAQVSVPVQLKTTFLDTRASTTPMTTLIKFAITNLSTGTLVFKNV